MFLRALQSIMSYENVRDSYKSRSGGSRTEWAKSFVASNAKTICSLRSSKAPVSYFNSSSSHQRTNSFNSMSSYNSRLLTSYQTSNYTTTFYYATGFGTRQEIQVWRSVTDIYLFPCCKCLRNTVKTLIIVYQNQKIIDAMY